MVSDRDRDVYLKAWDDRQNRRYMPRQYKGWERTLYRRAWDAAHESVMWIQSLGLEVSVPNMKT